LLAFSGCWIYLIFLSIFVYVAFPLQFLQTFPIRLPCFDMAPCHPVHLWKFPLFSALWTSWPLLCLLHTLNDDAFFTFNSIQFYCDFLTLCVMNCLVIIYSHLPFSYRTQRWFFSLRPNFTFTYRLCNLSLNFVSFIPIVVLHSITTSLLSFPWFYAGSSDIISFHGPCINHSAHSHFAWLILHVFMCLNCSVCWTSELSTSAHTWGLLFSYILWICLYSFQLLRAKDLRAVHLCETSGLSAHRVLRADPSHTSYWCVLDLRAVHLCAVCT
jgi:hypothetical protein